jgi:tocopherol O-methyltransferase
VSTRRRLMLRASAAQRAGNAVLKVLPLAFGSSVKVKYDRNAGLHVLQVPGLSQARPPVWTVLVFAYGVYRFLRRRSMKKIMSRPFGRDDLNDEIASFYDYRSAAWEVVWGEHLHHGLYYGRGGKRDRPLKGREAQIETMREMLRIGKLDSPTALANVETPMILDVGCGIGGATRFLANRFEKARVTGITLSPVQAQRASELNAEAGLDGRVANFVLDALDMDFPDDTFDVVWSLESAEHIPDKDKLVSECMRVLKPGGTLIMLAWCLRESFPPIALHEQVSIRAIQREYCLPRLAPPSEYQNLMRRYGLRRVAEEDWTARAAPFWWEVARTAAASRSGWSMLRKYGWPLIRSALAMRHVIVAIRKGTFKLAAMTAVKPTAEEARADDGRKESLKGNCLKPAKAMP